MPGLKRMKTVKEVTKTTNSICLRRSTRKRNVKVTPFHFNADQSLINHQEKQYEVEQESFESEIRVQNVFGNHLILDKILENLHYGDIKNACLISRAFNDAGNRQLNKLNLFNLEICFYNSDPTSINCTEVDKSGVNFTFSQTMEQIKNKLNPQPISQEHPHQQKRRQTKNDKEIWLTLLYSDISLPALTDFFKLFNPSITHLTFFDGSSLGPTPGSLFKLIIQLEYLEYLSFIKVPDSWKINKLSLFDESHEKIVRDNGDEQCMTIETSTIKHLNRVITLSFSNSSSLYSLLVQNVLSVVPNVRKILDFPLHCLSALDNVNNMTKIKNSNSSGILLEKVKSIALDFVPYITLEHKNKARQLSILSGLCSQMKLHSMAVPLEKWSMKKSNNILKKCCLHFSSILDQISETLETLTLEPLPLPECLNLPVLPNVKNLILRGLGKGTKSSSNKKQNPNNKDKIIGIDTNNNNDFKDRFFTQDFNINRTFPNVTCVEIRTFSNTLSHDQLFPQCNFQPGGACLPNVRLLKLRDSDTMSIDLLMKIASIFPRVKNLDVDGNRKWLELFMPDIWRLWSGLEYLSMEINLGDGFKRFSVPNLDGVFTGIHEEKCASLRKLSEKVDIDIEKYRLRPAVSTMKNLKQLRIVFKGYLCKTQDVKPLFSKVSVWYGFDLVSDLQVILGLPLESSLLAKEKITTMLEDILPYVTFYPNVL